MRVLLFGATGMVGRGVLLECLDDPRVQDVCVVSRRPYGIAHVKLREIVRDDLFRLDDLHDEFARVDACFICLGVTSVGMDEASYTHLTYDLTRAIADAVMSAGAVRTFCYVSGQGTDSTERGRTMWARVKGRTENYLLSLPATSYMFRPGYIQPLRGVRSKTGWYQALYDVVGFLYPLLRRVAPRYVTTTVDVGRAMIAVADHGFHTRILETADINAAATS
jgi:uncharacterized protein YbjT (DUF2867 family)